MATGDGGEGSPIEIDPLGGSVGMFTPYITLSVGMFTPYITLSGGTYTPRYPDLIQPYDVSEPTGPDFSSLYATFGSRTADLPGFGTNWGSFAAIHDQEMDERWTNLSEGIGFLTLEEISAWMNAYTAAQTAAGITVGHESVHAAGDPVAPIDPATGSTEGDDSSTLVSQTLAGLIDSSVTVSPNWDIVDAREGGNGFSSKPHPYTRVKELRNEFKRRLALNSGDCKKKLQQLFNKLGTDENVEDFAEKFFDLKGTRKIVSDTPKIGTADYAYGVITITPGGNITQDGGNFIHELAHAAGGLFVGASHQQIVSAMAEVDGFSFTSIQKEIESEADKLKITGKDRESWVEQRYSNRMNNWLGNYCAYEGGNQAWKDYIKNHQ